ncbi:MAG: hypothetical protein A2086_11850 [Spirochaetes bacterium GWD1_27_9]|nr:MAG: hypothetical protein A2Y34_16165 [Spirochaetes bacterium GWC1_27_15]OHD28652.1 MAG: hypothetical protein A2086_11850 [Spirochaetes bacterium GWD1_27_9]
MAKKILIVEDEPILAMFLRFELVQSGYEVIDSVSTGKKAITSAIEMKPDVILMDIFLDDEMTGIEAVKYIHKSVKIPIIYLTASEDPETYSKLKETDFTKIIVKPYIFSNIKDTIDGIEFMNG